MRRQRTSASPKVTLSDSLSSASRAFSLRKPSKSSNATDSLITISSRACGVRFAPFESNVVQSFHVLFKRRMMSVFALALFACFSAVHAQCSTRKLLCCRLIVVLPFGAAAVARLCARENCNKEIFCFFGCCAA